MTKCKDCFCNCHCNVKGHSDSTGVCPCEKCNCNPQGATVNDDECLSCQKTKQNVVEDTQRKKKHLVNVARLGLSKEQNNKRMNILR